MKWLGKYAICGVVFAMFLAPASVTTATELVWAPINPSFVGGVWYNAQWLMNSAQVQNKHVKKADPYTSSVSNPMDDFANNLNRQLFSRLSSKILDEAFGEDSENPLQTGQYTVGDYTVDITTNGNITVVITDEITGNQTTVAVPYY